MSLIAYAGCRDADAATEQPVQLVGNEVATALTACQPFAHWLVRSPSRLGPVAGGAHIGELDPRGRREADGA